jgi:hypothetical protein
VFGLKRRFLFSALLLSSIILVLLAPNVDSQSYTTVTSFRTTTAYNQVLTVLSSASSITHVDRLSINPPSPEACGATVFDLIRGNEGDNLIVSLFSTQDIDFFVFASLDDYVRWAYGNPCNFDSANNALVKKQDVNSYAFDMTLQHNIAVIAFLYTSHGSSIADITVTQMMSRQMIATVRNNLTVTKTVQALELSKLNVSDTSKGGLPVVGGPVMFATIPVAVILVIGFILYRVASNKPKKRMPAKRNSNRI